MTKRLLAALFAVTMVGVTMAVASAGAQEPENPWFVNRYEPGGLAEIEEVRANGRVAFNFPLGRVYGTAAHDFYVMTGEDLTNFCLGDLPRSETLIGFRQNGEFVMRTPPGGIDVTTYVYARTPGNDDIFTWIDEQCGAWATDGTPLPSPVAAGFTNLRINSNPEVPFWADGGEGSAGFRRNGVNGTLSDVDGNLWDLSTRAVFSLDPERQGPPEFIRHEVTLTPSAG